MAQPVPRSLPTPTSADPAEPAIASPCLPERAGPATPAKVVGEAAAPQLRSAVGYLCVTGDEALINLLHGHLTSHAEHAGLDLIEIYVDRPAAGEVGRPGLQLAVDEIGRHADAILLIPDLSHLPVATAGPAAFSEQFFTVVTEIHALDAHPAPPFQAAAGGAPTAPAAETGTTPEAGLSRARLTAEGLFEATVRPDEDVASVIGTLRQLPAAARFLEALGDVETTLVFAPVAPPTDNAARLGELVPLATVGPARSVGRGLVGRSDVAVRLRAALAGIPLRAQDEEVVAWLATQPADRVLAISRLLQRARSRAA